MLINYGTKYTDHDIMNIIILLALKIVINFPDGCRQGFLVYNKVVGCLDINLFQISSELAVKINILVINCIFLLVLVTDQYNEYHWMNSSILTELSNCPVMHPQITNVLRTSTDNI